MSVAMDHFRTHQAQFSPYPSLFYKRNVSSGNLKKLGFQGTSMQVEVMEVVPNFEIIGPGQYRCIVELFDSDTAGKLMWRQKTSLQEISKPMPIIFQDFFKVKNVNLDSYLDIKPGCVMVLSFVRVGKDAKSQETLDSITFSLNDLAINKYQEKKKETPTGTSMLVKFNLTNTSIPRGGTVKLKDLANNRASSPPKSPTARDSPALSQARLTENQSLYNLPRVSLKFSINYHTQMGEELRVVGSNYKLGDWDPANAAVMNWTGEGMWELELFLRKAYIPFEYKYVVYNTRTGHTRWEVTPNRKMASTESRVELHDTWEHKSS